MIQYKLLEVLDEETRKKIYDIFEEEDIYFFTKKIVGIKYDFKNKSYTEVLKKVIGLNLRQWIITSYRCNKIIS